MSRIPTPDVMPILTPGRHRTPRSGACFMEFASYLAGERWSDSPRCTDPSLALMARLVNDTIPRAHRSRLTPLIPSVIGLVGDPERTGILVAVNAGAAALPVAGEPRQRAIAAGLLGIDELLERRDDAALWRSRIRGALDSAPLAEKWAADFRTHAAVGPLEPAALSRVLQRITQFSVFGLADACVPDVGDRLFALLSGTIAEVTVLLHKEQPAEARVLSEVR
jgi:hypothetical protein